MANFNTHFSVALIASTALATYGAMAGLYGFFDATMLACAGTIGGLLPDIDLNHSKISRVGFNIASGIGAGFGLILYLQHHPTTPLHALMFGGLSFLIIRYGVFSIFGRVTVHRGMVHSVPYMALVSLLFVDFFHTLLDVSLILSWFLGVFVFFGAIIHLILDEIYSVNFFGLKVKKSFGTALKFFDKKNPFGYVVLYGLLGLAWYFSPAKLSFLKFIFAHFRA